jgi:hypothetical protein
VNQIDYVEMARLVGYSHAKNVKAAVNKMFERLKKQQNITAAGSSSTEKAITPEASDGDETVEESPKKPAAKKSAATATKPATTKKRVGKSTAPRKASLGGPKTPNTGKGKKAAQTEEIQQEVEAEGDADAFDAKSEGTDKAMKDDEEATGKSTQSPPVENKFPIEIPTTVASPEALAAAVADPAKPIFHILVQGYDYQYTPFDVSVASHYEMILGDYLQWKEYNDYTFYCGPRPYSWEEHLAQENARRAQARPEDSDTGLAAGISSTRILEQLLIEPFAQRRHKLNNISLSPKIAFLSVSPNFAQYCSRV